MKPKNPTRLFPLFLTEKLAETKAFYRDRIGFEVTVDVDGYFSVQSGGKDGPELCFMAPDKSHDGKKRPAFDGRGVIVSIPVPDADAAEARMRKAGIEIAEVTSDKPWGWRSFLALDPNGVALDFFHVYAEVGASSPNG